MEYLRTLHNDTVKVLMAHIPHEPTTALADQSTLQPRPGLQPEPKPGTPPDATTKTPSSSQTGGPLQPIASAQAAHEIAKATLYLSLIHI